MRVIKLIIKIIKIIKRIKVIILPFNLEITIYKNNLKRIKNLLLYFKYNF